MTLLAKPEFWQVKKIVEFDPSSIHGDLDQIGVCFTPNAGNCSGVINWMRIQPNTAARDLYYRVNRDGGGYTQAKKFQWGIRNIPGGAIYAPDGDAGVWQIPTIIMGSRAYWPGEYNIVKIVEKVPGYARMECIPPSLYETATFEQYPYYFYTCFSTATSGNTSMPVGGFRVPHFNPADFEHHGEYTGNWIRADALHSIVAYGEGTVEPPTEPPPAAGNYIVVLRRTALRQGPTEASSKMGIAYAGEVYRILETRNGWGLTVKGYINLNDTRPQ